jgi:predicted transcriptional regulator
MDRTSKTTLYFSPALYHRVKVFAAVRERTVTEVIEEALQNYLAANRGKERRLYARTK